MDFTLRDNLALRKYYREPFSGNGILTGFAINNPGLK